MKITQHAYARRTAPDTVPPYGTISYWQATAPARVPVAFSPRDRYDIAILGGGFTGLWTAYHLLNRDPAASIAIFERQEVGYGASGRNGGFAMPLLHHSLHNLVREAGADTARALHAAACEAVSHLCETLAKERIECELDQSGLLVVATNASQERKILRDLEAAQALGLTDVRGLTQAELAAIIRSPTYRSGLEQDGCATLHPLKLVRGLAALLERKGVHIFERCNVAEVEGTAGGVRLQANGRSITAEKGVLALNAWSSTMAPIDRDVMPVYSYIIATEPIPESRWSEIGWSRRYGVEDKRYHVHFYRRSADNRILWGGRRAMSSVGARIVPTKDANRAVFGLLAESFAETFPQLSDIKFAFGWGGPIAVTVGQLPSFGTLGDGRLHYGHGYCGHGVGPSFLGGRILSELTMGAESERTRLPFVNKPHELWPREPWRTAGMTTALRETYWRDESAHAGKDTHQEPFSIRLGRALFARRSK
jgi:glycine/D-amino acid oxidase-like deaminating enzyme